MTFGFPAHAEGFRRFPFPPDHIAHATMDALTVLGWRLLNDSPTHFEAKIRFNHCCWGEIVHVDIASDGTVSVKSRCIGRQVFDWGKNERNVEKFLNQLSRAMDPSPVPPCISP